MAKRDSFEKTASPLKPSKNFHDIGDGHSVDTSLNLLTFFWKFGWLFAVISVMTMVLLKVLFPSFVEKNSEHFNKLSATYWAEQAIELSKKEGIREFRLVGTGLHLHFKTHPEDKKLFFFDGQLLVMRDYFTNQNRLDLEEKSFEQNGITDVPLTDLDYDEAQELCQLLGARLPTYSELIPAEMLCQRHGKNLIKPNLKGCKFNLDKKMWTSTAEPGFFFGVTDNYRIYQPGSESSEPEYQDDGFESGDIGFRCVKDLEVQDVPD